MVIVGQAQAQRRDAGALQNAAELNLAVPFAVPLRKHYDRQILPGSEETSPHRVVFRIRSFDRTGKLQDLTVEVVIRGGFAGIKSGAVAQPMRDVIAHGGIGIAVGLNAEMVGSPVEGKRFAITVAAVKEPFALFDVTPEHIRLL